MTQAPEIPTVTLADSVEMPMVGFGTWKITGDSAERLTEAALAAGYRHIDTATVYGNEGEIGEALAASGMSREDVFITTKIRPSDVGKEEEALRRSLRLLRTDYVDLWLIHWPPRTARASRQLWNAMRELRDQDLTRAIGVSNYELSDLDDLIESTGERPAVNQIRWGPSRYDVDELVGHKARGVVVEGYSPLKDTRLSNKVLTGIAQAHGVSTAQVVLRWHLEHGITVIPKSEQPARIAQNLDLLGFELTPAEVEQIDSLSSR